MRTWLVIAATVLLAACGGKGGGTPADIAAQACEAETKKRLDGKLYEIDVAALANSMKDAPNGEHTLSASVVIEPGMTSETKQTFECTVRFTEGKETPDIINFVFNW